MKLVLQRANAARLVSSCLAVVLLAACSEGKAPITLARPQPQGRQVQALSTGYAGTATFDAPVVDANSWQGTPVGTGSYALQSSPAVNGGPQAIGSVDAQNGTTTHYVIVSDFQAGPGNFFAVVSEGMMSVGTWQVDNVKLFAGVFDGTTGQPVALATSGTVTLTAADAIGGRVTGDFSGTLDDVVSTPPVSCTSAAQCAAGELCVGGVCTAAPPGCTSNAQCSSGQTCQAGRCVGGPVGACDGKQGTGSYSGQVSSAAVCSAFGPGSVSVGQAAAAMADDGNGLVLYVVDPSRDTAGLLLPLGACPQATGAVQVAGATFWDQTSAGGATFYASWGAQSAQVNFTQVGAQLQGTFSVLLPGGGQLGGTFDVQ